MIAGPSLKMLTFPDRAFGMDVYDGTRKKCQRVLKRLMGRPNRRLSVPRLAIFDSRVW